MKCSADIELYARLIESDLRRLKVRKMDSLTTCQINNFFKTV